MYFEHPMMLSDEKIHHFFSTVGRKDVGLSPLIFFHN